MTHQPTTIVGPGLYRTVDGYEIRKVEDWDNIGLSKGWHLIDPTGEYCNTFATKREAAEAAESIQEIANRYRIEGNR